jgi:hypothetical protein
VQPTRARTFVQQNAVVPQHLRHERHGTAEHSTAIQPAPSHAHWHVLFDADAAAALAVAAQRTWPLPWRTSLQNWPSYTQLKPCAGVHEGTIRGQGA